MGMSVRCVDLENALAALVPIDSPGKQTTHNGGNCFALPAGDSLSSAVRSSGHRMTIGFLRTSLVTTRRMRFDTWPPLIAR